MNLNFEEVLKQTFEKLDTTLLALNNARAKDDQYSGAVSVWRGQFETLQQAASEENFNALALLAKEIITCLKSMQSSSSDVIKRYAELLKTWTEQVTEYLHSDAATQQQYIENLLIPIPSESRQKVLAVFTSTPIIINEEQAQALVNVLDSALEELAQPQNIEPAEWDVNASEQFMAMLLSALDNIILTAEMFQLTELLAISNQINQTLDTMATAEHALSKQQFTLLFNWLQGLRHAIVPETELEDFVFFLENSEKKALQDFLTYVPTQSNVSSSSSNLSASSTASMPKVAPKHVTADEQIPTIAVSPTSEIQLVEVELAELAELEAEEVEQVEQDQFDVAEFDTSTILGMLSQELLELSEEMTELLQQVSRFSAKDQQQKAIAQYHLLIERLAETAETLQLDGLRSVCDFVAKNFDLAVAKKATWKSSSKLLKVWPRYVIDYLNSPEDKKAGHALIDCLKNKKWQQPLTKDTAKTLLESLSNNLKSSDFFVEQEARETIANQADVVLDISENSSQSLIDAFFQDSPVVASRLSECIENIATDNEALENISAAQRYAHTLKGSAGLLGIKGIANLSHHLEDILEYLHCHSSKFPDQTMPVKLVSVLQEATDCIESMLDAMQGKDDYPEHAIRILQDLLDIANQIDHGTLDFSANDEQEIKAESKKSKSKKSKKDERQKQSEPSSNNIANTNIEDNHPGSIKMEDSLYVPTRVVDNMFKLVGELVVMTNRIQDNLRHMKAQGHELQVQDKLFQQQRIELEELVNVQRFTNYQRQAKLNQGLNSTFDSLELDQYDDLHGTVNGLIESVVDKNEISRSIQQYVADLEELVVDQRRLNSDLQQIVMSARMVAVNTVVPRMQRTVRQTARNTGKKVNLVIEGKDLLLDCDILSKITDPVLHLLRNAVDHGIETVAEREKAGKKVPGEIKLLFSQTGNSIEVVCCDDGRGLDYKRIKDLAIEKNMITKKTKLGNEDLAKLIISPGFTTRETVTHISGRGIGMDVVNTVVQSYGGVMTVGDNAPYGCKIEMRIPISLVTTHSIIVKCGAEVYAVPSNSLQKVIPSQLGGLQFKSGKPWFSDEEGTYPAIFLSSLVSYGEQTRKHNEQTQVALLASNTNNEIVAILVDDVLSSDDLVIKGTGRFVPDISGIAGVSIIGDGGVVPVLDIKALLRDSINKPYKEMSSNFKPKVPPLRKVLIVDDSISVRKSLAELIQDAGYEALVARNGVEAISMIRKQEPNVVLSDLEMPKMNGLELTSNIRADSSLKKLPVIMVTSRTSSKHRQQAMSAGVNEYLTKPYTEDELLDLIENFI